MTHTYAELEVSRATYDEIAQKLRDAGYDHAFMPERNRESPTIDMHGIGLILEGTAMAEQITDAPLTDDMEIEIDVQVLQDRVAPKVEALAFNKGDDTLRLTGLKASGSWTVKREYRCRFTVGDLRRLARSITQKGKADDGGTGTSDVAERPGAQPGNPGAAGGPEPPAE